MEKAVAGEELKKLLKPDWLLECVSYDPKRNAIVISPKKCLEHGVTVLEVAQDSFASRTILRFRLDFDIKFVKEVKEDEQP